MKTPGVPSILLLTFALAGPSAGEAQVLRPSELCTDHSDAAIATFEDAELGARVRAELGLDPEDDLTCGLVTSVARLSAPLRGIASLAGIQNLTSLTLARLGGSMTDISALRGLTSLTRLSLVSNATDISALTGFTSLTTLYLGSDAMTDISALRGLTSLTDLRLSGTSITDISALSGLTSLTELYLGTTAITDISALTGLTSLTTLRLENNSITDISALSELTSLTTLRLNFNPDLSNIQGLLSNTGLGAGDGVWLLVTSVNCTDVALLGAKGVTVRASC